MTCVFLLAMLAYAVLFAVDVRVRWLRGRKNREVIDMTQELKPCPFCGGEAAVCEGGINGKMRVYGLVEHKDGCFFLADGLPTRYQNIMESEFDIWNTRAERTRCDENYGGTFVCSECGANVKDTYVGRSYVDKFGKRWYGTSHEHHFNYCPNCGARVVDE